MHEIQIQPLSRECFAPFGDVIEMTDRESFPINAGMCDRFHDLARLEFIGDGGRPNISLAHSRPYALPLKLSLVERHPLGSQAFIPLSQRPFLVVVAPDENGAPGTPRAFMTRPGQGINYLRNIWHGVLTPFDEPADFVIVDRAGEGENLEEHHFETPYLIVAPNGAG